MGEVREKVEGQQFTRGVANTNMTDYISSLQYKLYKTPVKTTFRVLCLYSLRVDICFVRYLLYHKLIANSLFFLSFGGGGSLIRIKDAKDEVKWFFEVETIPRERTTFTWLLPSGDEVPHKELEKYSKEVDGNKVKLVIKVGETAQMPGGIFG